VFVIQQQNTTGTKSLKTIVISYDLFRGQVYSILGKCIGARTAQRIQVMLWIKSGRLLYISY
jgi:hypothetical protein